jgi:hypothetical protein
MTHTIKRLALSFVLANLAIAPVMAEEMKQMSLSADMQKTQDMQQKMQSMHQDHMNKMQAMQQKHMEEVNAQNAKHMQDMQAIHQQMRGQ